MSQMHYVIDTSSLDRLAQYFMPFDNNKELKNFLIKCFNDEVLIFLKTVQDELFRKIGASRSEYLDNISFLKKEEIEKKTGLLKKPKTFDVSSRVATYKHQLEYSWTIGKKAVEEKKAEITPTGQGDTNKFETLRHEFIESADFHLIVYAKKNNYAIITEESSKQNDGKLYKKIPLICEQENITCMNIATFLKEELPKINPSKKLQLIISNSN